MAAKGGSGADNEVFWPLKYGQIPARFKRPKSRANWSQYIKDKYYPTLLPRSNYGSSPLVPRTDKGGGVMPFSPGVGGLFGLAHNNPTKTGGIHNGIHTPYHNPQDLGFYWAGMGGGISDPIAACTDCIKAKPGGPIKASRAIKIVAPLGHYIGGLYGVPRGFIDKQGGQDKYQYAPMITDHLASFYGHLKGGGRRGQKWAWAHPPSPWATQNPPQR